MDIKNLVNMANRIGEFFETMPNREQAKSDVALHLSHFWEPRMREKLLQQLDSPEGRHLSAFVREAVEDNRSRLTPQKPVVLPISA